MPIAIWPTPISILPLLWPLLERVDEVRTAAKAGLELDPAFTIRRFQENLSSDNQIYLAKRERVYEGMRKARVPEGSV